MSISKDEWKDVRLCMAASLAFFAGTALVVLGVIALFRAVLCS